MMSMTSVHFFDMIGNVEKLTGSHGNLSHGITKGKITKRTKNKNWLAQKIWRDS